jgi:PAS domain S-box-containing protein
MDHLPAAVFIKAANRRVFFVNEYLKRHFGTGDLPMTNSAGDDPGAVIEQLSYNDQMVSAEGWYEIVKPLKDRAGKERTFRIHNFAISKREGEETLLCGIAWDITATVTATKALSVSERRYRRIFETAEEGIWLVDAEGNTLEANERMGRMLGCTDYEMLDRQMFEFMDEQACDAAKVLLDRCRQGVEERCDFRFRTGTGADLWTIVSSTPMHDAKGVYIWVRNTNPFRCCGTVASSGQWSVSPTSPNASLPPTSSNKNGTLRKTFSRQPPSSYCC